MKKKTEEKLRKRWESLPLCHIDASIILEILLKGKFEHECKSFLNRVGYKYRGVLSVPVLGEVDKGIFKIESVVEREIARDFVDKLIMKRRISIFSSTYETYSIALKIREINSFIKSMDALHIACAIVDKADTFITLDNELVKSKEIEKEFGIKIKHPSEL